MQRGPTMRKKGSGKNKFAISKIPVYDKSTISATEIIDAIESLPVAERVQVIRYVTGTQSPPLKAHGVWHDLNIRDRQKRICGECVLPNLVLETRLQERY